MPSFAGDRRHGRPLGGVLVPVLDDHPDGPLTHLRRVPGSPWHCSILSRDGASRIPGAVHPVVAPSRVWSAIQALDRCSSARSLPPRGRVRPRCHPFPPFGMGFPARVCSGERVDAATGSGLASSEWSRHRARSGCRGSRPSSAPGLRCWPTLPAGQRPVLGQTVPIVGDLEAAQRPVGGEQDGGRLGVSVLLDVGHRLPHDGHDVFRHDRRKGGIDRAVEAQRDLETDDATKDRG